MTRESGLEGDVEVVPVVIETNDEAVERSFVGSPTVCVDGRADVASDAGDIPQPHDTR